MMLLYYYYWTIIPISILLAILSSGAAANASSTMTSQQPRRESNKHQEEEVFSDRTTEDHHHHRKLQQQGSSSVEDPCFWDSDPPFIAFDEGWDYWKPSEYTECAKSLSIVPENMKLHIQSINQIFQQYYAFYDIAKDPAASVGSYQRDLGYTLYGEGQGQVNIDSEMNAILDDIDANNGASMATFWEIRSVFNQLRDGHVSLDYYQRFWDYLIGVFPERLANDDENSLSVSFYLDDDQTLQLSIATQVPLNTTTEPIQVRNVTEVKNVTTINGLSVAEYVTYLANSPELRIPFQDVGARVNFLIQNDALFWAGETKWGFSGSGTPSSLLPDSFVVTYDDGTSETYLVAILPSNEFFDWDNKTDAEAYINESGAMYDAYQRATGRIGELSMTREEAAPAPMGDVRKKNLKKAAASNSLFNETIPGKGGFLVEDDYLVMKLSTFDIELEDVKRLWSQTAEAAKQKGIKKLLIDTSGNPGGLVQAGYGLLFLMFPSAGLEWFTNQWNIPYNGPMREFVEALLPLIDILLDESSKLSDETLIQFIESFTDDAFLIYKVAGEAIVELCTNSNPKTCDDQVTYLQSNVTNFVTNPDLTTYGELFLSLAQTIVEYSPWSVVLRQVESEEAGADDWPGAPSRNRSMTAELISAGVQTHIFGGVESNFTAKFDLEGRLTGLIYADAASLSAQIDYTFDEYVFVSDGVSGSMGAVFTLEAAQLYKNRDRSGVQTKVTLAAYGGLGNGDDFAIACFPASVKWVSLEDPIIGDAALQMLAGLIPSNATGLDNLIQRMLDYSQTVTKPPYYGHTLPHLPVVAFYSVFMEPGALPLQYVHIPLDEYIPELFTEVSFDEQDDLPLLYKAASSLFS